MSPSSPIPMPASTSTPVLKPDTQLLPEAMPASGATPDDSLEDGEITEDETVVPTSPPPSPTAPKPKQMTPHELTLAKDLVLDLLGWGVTPEYLLDVGVSGQALHRIFSDLRLRMPRTMCIGGGGGGAGVDEGGVARRAGYGCEIDRGGVGGRADGR